MGEDGSSAGAKPAQGKTSAKKSEESDDSIGGDDNDDADDDSSKDTKETPSKAKKGEIGMENPDAISENEGEGEMDEKTD